MVVINQSRKIIILGDSGSGKTTLLKHLIDKFSQKWPCYIYNTDYEPFKMNDRIKPIKLIKQFDIRGHVAIFDDNRIYFVIDELKKKYYV